MAATSRTKSDADDDARTSGALTVETARLAQAALHVICGLVEALPDTVMGKRPGARAAAIRKLYFYVLSGWMGAQVIERITGYNAAHINREVGAVWRWAEGNAVIEQLLERIDGWFASFPELVCEVEELVCEMMLEKAADRVRAAAERVVKPAAPPRKNPPAAPALAPSPAPRGPRGGSAVRLAVVDGAHV